MSIFWIVLVALVLAGLQSLVFGLFNLKRLEYRRYFSRTHLFEGESLEMVEVLRNKKPVSYTHLDVYKRQVSSAGPAPPGRGRGPSFSQK